LIWSYPARRDLYAIAAHYKQYGADLPLQMLERIGDAPRILLDYPDLGTPTPRRGVRKWTVKGTTFVLLYVLRGDDVEIRRVVHAAQDWRNP